MTTHEVVFWRVLDAQRRGETITLKLDPKRRPFPTLISAEVSGQLAPVPLFPAEAIELIERHGKEPCVEEEAPA